MFRPCLTLLRRAVAPALLALALTSAASAKDKEPPIRIGEINSYKAIPAFLGPYKKVGSWRWKRSMQAAACWAESWK